MAEILIRSVEAKDADHLRKLYEGERAYSGTLQLPRPSLRLWETRLEKSNREGVHQYVAEMGSDIVGHMFLDNPPSPRRRHVGYLAMAVRDDSQGQGVGSALMAAMVDLADNWLNLRRMELTVYVDNDPAIQLYKKFGFQIEGESPDYAFRNGEYVGVYHMGRINKRSLSLQ